MNTQLSEEQINVVKAVVSRRNVFLTGDAGCGKTVTLNAIIASLRGKYGDQFKKHVAVCAPTGVAATHIGGRTYHSALGIGLVRRMSDFPQALSKRGIAQRLRALEVLILDEISMVSAEMFECLHWYLGQARKRSTEPFGGVQLVVCGDMGQIMPIAGSPNLLETIPDAFLNRGYAFQAPVWRRCRFHCVYLRHIWRQTDPHFASLLHELKEGRKEALEELLRMCARPLPDQHGILPTELFSTNREADAVNERAMRALEGLSREFVAIDNVSAPHLTPAGRAKWGQHEFFRECPAPALLVLKVGAQVMLVKNLEFMGGSNMLVNGSRGKVIGFNAGGDPIVEFRNGRIEELSVTEFAQEIADGVQASRQQLPLRLAWSLTINKAQGCTLDCARVSLDRIFATGQAYVALSRVRDASALEISCGPNRPDIAPAPEVVAFYQDMAHYDGTEAWEEWMREHPIPFF